MPGGLDSCITGTSASTDSACANARAASSAAISAAVFELHPDGRSYPLALVRFPFGYFPLALLGGMLEAGKVSRGEMLSSTDLQATRE